jgi:hypothetical protein
MAVDAQNGGLEAQNGVLVKAFRPAVVDSHPFEETLDPDPH